MRSVITVIPALATTPAVADPGHFADLSGHSHWIAFGALAAAGLLAAALAGRKGDTEAEDEAEEPETKETPA